jgi:glycosyltransferase involved in cell wall biosynthesis
LTSNDTLLSDFRAAHGRPLRVLLIGNIANYAFVLAKLLRRAGVDCYVADPDFYHIMASPEWLEADFTGDWGDDFLPKWSNINLHGYKRPDWFIQAPAHDTFRHLTGVGKPTSLHDRLEKRWLGFSRDMATNDLPKIVSWLLTSQFPMLVFFRRAFSWLKRNVLVPRATSSRDSALVEGQGDDVSQDDAFASLGMSPSLRLHAHNIGYLAAIDTYKAALAPFDIVQGFTLSAIFAAFAEHPRYCAIELGTLRGLPFEDSDIGRLTAWLYQRAPEVQITNVDCVDAANRLKIPQDRQHKVLHPYDTETAYDYAQQNRGPNKPFFLAPARHHWKEGNASWLKGNDIIIRAAGKLAREGYVFGLTFVDWGLEVELSKALIKQEGLEAVCTWIKPQPRLALWPLYMSCAAVVDQFQAAAFGGVGLDTMALGKRLISRYDDHAGSLFFAEPPPMFNCSTVEEVAAAMALCLDDLQDEGGRGAQLQDWVTNHHGPQRQLADQFAVFASLLNKAPV